MAQILTEYEQLQPNNPNIYLDTSRYTEILENDM